MPCRRGAGRRPGALDRTVAYARERVQFGRAIGSFQAYKHRLADMMIEIEQARSAVYWAACAVDEGSDEAALALHAAKSFAADTFFMCAANMIQLHGGIGFTWEHDAHLFFKRARSHPDHAGRRQFPPRTGRSDGAGRGRMKLGFSPAEEAFRAECADWLTAQMAGEFADIKGITTLTAKAERRKEWEQQLAAHKWSCIGWPERMGRARCDRSPSR